MNVIYSGYTFRTVDNFRPVLDALSSRGHRVGYCVFPHTGVPKNLELGRWPFERLAYRPLPDLRALPPNELEEILIRAIREFSADALLVDDMLNYPSNAICGLVKRHFAHIPVLVFQHGFYQHWHVYRQHFACDYFLAYGPRDKRQFLAEQQPRVVVFGLPKLARLRDLPVSDDGSVLFVAQEHPRPEIVLTALREYTQRSGRRVTIRLHPQYKTYDLPAIEMAIDRAEDDIVPKLASCHAVITTASTAGFEALCLGKPVVALPGHAYCVYEGSPCVAFDFTGAEIERVLTEQTWDWRLRELEQFKQDAISPLSFEINQATDQLEALIDRSLG